MEAVELVKVLPTKIWAEKDMFGTVNIKLQHEGLEAFNFVQINYNYRYTSNAHQYELTQRILALLGADVPNVQIEGQPASGLSRSNAGLCVNTTE